MKRTLIILCMFLSVSPSLTAKQKQIYLSHKWACKQLRTKSVIPTISYDDNCLYVMSQCTLPNVTITVTEIETDITVFQETISIEEQVENMFVVNFDYGCYDIEMTIGDKSYFGHFDVGEAYGIYEE